MEFCTALVIGREVFKESLQRIKDMRHKSVSLHCFHEAEQFHLLSYFKLNTSITIKFILLHHLYHANED